MDREETGLGALKNAHKLVHIAVCDPDLNSDDGRYNQLFLFQWKHFQKLEVNVNSPWIEVTSML